jgi:hypothetical protein
MFFEMLTVAYVENGFPVCMDICDVFVFSKIVYLTQFYNYNPISLNQRRRFGWLRMTVAGLSPWEIGLHPGQVDVELVIAMWHSYILFFFSSNTSIFFLSISFAQCSVLIFAFICHWRCTFIASDRVVKWIIFFITYIQKQLQYITLWDCRNGVWKVKSNENLNHSNEHVLWWRGLQFLFVGQEIFEGR